MILPDHIFAIVNALHAQNLPLALGDDEARRSLQKKVVETAVARFPDEGWGWKSAGPGRPPSKDAIANCKLAPGHLLAWDCFNGATRAPARSESLTIDEQTFIPISGFDHLAGLRLDDRRDVQPAPPASSPHASAPPASAPQDRPALPGRAEFQSALMWLDTLYRTQLDRPGGVDIEGIAAHVFDTYLQARLAGASVDEAKAAVVKTIADILQRTDIHV